MSGQRVYPPYGHYLVADYSRSLICVAAVVAAVLIVAVAWQRVRTRIYSAVLFFAALVLAQVLVIGDSLAGLGHPPIYWLHVTRALIVALCYIAARLVPGEARSGVWARPRARS